MPARRPVRDHNSKRAAIVRLRKAETARRDKAVVREALMLKDLTPAQRIQVLIELSEVCVGLGRGLKK